MSAFTAISSKAHHCRIVEKQHGQKQPQADPAPHHREVWHNVANELAARKRRYIVIVNPEWLAALESLLAAAAA